MKKETILAGFLMASIVLLTRLFMGSLQLQRQQPG